MNDDLWNFLVTILEIKIGTKATWVSFEYAPYGIKIRVDWDDDKHCVYGLGTQQIKTANYDLKNFLISYFNSEHEATIK